MDKQKRPLPAVGAHELGRAGEADSSWPGVFGDGHRRFDRAISPFRAWPILAGERAQVENAAPANKFHRSRCILRTDPALYEGQGTFPGWDRFAYDRLC